MNSLVVTYAPARRRPVLVTGDLVIDGTPLLIQVERCTGEHFDVVSPIGWMPKEYVKSWARRLSGVEPPLLPSGRCELLICPECGNLACGFISCAVSRDGDQIVWSELGYETNSDPENVARFEMGYFRFSSKKIARILGSE